MRLIRQSVLYFKEGNSDKVYEIDLCDVGGEKYVVNFRYGRRGASLKEGTKTAVPVSLSEAEKVYDAVETEKINKGYTASEAGVSQLPKAPPFSLPEQPLNLSMDWAAWPAGRNKAILQRLHNTATGNTTVPKTSWKLSRIIWKAGEYKIKEASPYLIQLYSKGNNLQQYSCAWSLARCGGDAAIPVLQSLYSSHPDSTIKKIAGAGLLLRLSGLEKNTVVQHYVNSLPEAIAQLVNENDGVALKQVLTERTDQQQPQYNWLEDLYLAATDKRWIRPLLKDIIKSLPLKPGYFRHIRHIYKLAELLDDYEFSGLLSHRFEREQEMFSHQLTAAEKVNQKTFVEPLAEFVNLSQELKKQTSRIAYSQRTRWYLHRRTSRKLAMLGHNENPDYVKLATALLLAYEHNKDFSKEYSTYNYRYINNRYQQIETRFPQNANAVYMHYILSGNHPELKLTANRKRWQVRNEEAKQPEQARQPSQSGGGLLKKLAGLFGKKKEEPAAAIVTNVQSQPANENGTPFLHLWNQVPQAFVQLLMQAEMEEIHEFAEGALTRHEQFNEIKTKLDKQACKQLLLSAFAIPARFGYSLSKEKYSNSIADDDLVLALLNSVNLDATALGKQWTESYASSYLQQSGFITGLLFGRTSELRSWGKSFLQQKNIEPPVKKATVGKAVAEMMALTSPQPETEKTINDASDTLFELFGDEIKDIDLSVVSDLLKHPNPAVLLFGLRTLKAKEKQLNLDELSDDFISSLLLHSHAPVRDAGIGFLNGMNDKTLLQRQQTVITNCVSPFENVRTGLTTVVGRMAKADKTFGDKAAETLMPYLLRKEHYEGLHKDVSHLLCNELSSHLQNANKETALTLLYSNYSAAQNVGVIILEKYTEPAQLTIPQVIALGGHENLNVREWCWKFYKEQAARIRYEKDAAIRLLESKWTDTRQFAMQYFKEQFTENDWSSEVLISLADSVKPDVEAYGRELITKYFQTEKGTEYLLKLSQHPSEKMQLFSTNYLEHYAGGDVQKIQSLEFYFRSVLTRVNKSRIAKNRIYHFLLTEGLKSEVAAKIISRILSDVSATAAIGDKAKCIQVLLQIKAVYNVATPLSIKEYEARV